MKEFKILFESNILISQNYVKSFISNFLNNISFNNLNNDIAKNNIKNQKNNLVETIRNNN